MFEATASMALALMDDSEPDDGTEAIVAAMPTLAVANARNGLHDAYLTITQDEFGYWGLRRG